MSSSFFFWALYLTFLQGENAPHFPSSSEVWGENILLSKTLHLLKMRDYSPMFSSVLSCAAQRVWWAGGQWSSLDGPGLSAKVGQSRIYLGLWCSSGCLFSAMISEQWSLKRGSHLEVNMIHVRFEHKKMLIFDLYKWQCHTVYPNPLVSIKMCDLLMFWIV